MNNKKTVFIILVSMIIVSVWLKSYFSHPLPNYTGTQTLPGLKEIVEVFTDSFGAPHVFAQNEEDLFFTAGYLVARERLFQLSLRAASGRGELSAFLGDGQLSSDIYLRTYGIPEVAARITAALDSETLSLLEAYCGGVNQWIDESRENFPIEFKLLRSEPIRWKPSDVIATARLMARELQQSWRVEIVMGALAEKIGTEKIMGLFPQDTDDVKIVPPLSNLSTIFESINTEENKIRTLLGTDGSVLGSNNWVTSGSRTASGKPILCNDPHLGTEQPSWWYEMHLKGGRFNISGICLPGMPSPVIGQNENCAWGFTNVMADDMDFFVETIHPEDASLYRHRGEWKKIQERTEVIPLKSGGDTTITVRLTEHGPIISDIHNLLKDSDTAVSMAWMGHHESNEIKALLEITTVSNWDDFTEVVSQIWVPGQNIVFADWDGNIGWRPAVKVPIRKEASSLLPRPGESGAYDWTGYVPFEEMPFLYNPDEGFIATANNKTIDDSYPHYISNQFGPPSRVQRIHEMIEEKQNITAEDMKKMHVDWLSPQAREITGFLLQGRNGKETGNLKTAYNFLFNWDFMESPESPAALVYHVAFNHLLENVYGDELATVGDGALKAFVAMPMVPIRSLLALLRSGRSEWFDDINSSQTETMEDILRLSMVEAVADIGKNVSRIPGRWKWSKVHRLTYEHPLGGVRILDKLFGLNVGPFPAGGSSGTVNKGQYRHLESYTQIIGPSMRRIVDFSDLNRTQFVLPTGQSGIPSSPHYNDQAEMFLNGEYRTTFFDEDFIRSSTEFRKLVLNPAE